MAKKKTLYICQTCGYESGKWFGQCPRCSEWESMMKVSHAVKGDEEPAHVLTLADKQRTELVRYPADIHEWDETLGGGVSRGGVYLLSGEPGIGKSTLLLQLADAWAGKGFTVLYAHLEEAFPQIVQRVERLALTHAESLLFATGSAESLLQAIQQKQPHIVLIDSLQTIRSSQIPSLPGTPSQVRTVTDMFVQDAKRYHRTYILVAHVTKQGFIAGPKMVEHMVDGILLFEGDKRSQFRILRVRKHRYGPAERSGFFEMTERGLVGVHEGAFSHTRAEPVEGEIFVPLVEGHRILRVAVQALVSPTLFPSGRRTASGIEVSRLHILTAICEHHLRIPMSKFDVYVKLATGFRSRDPGLDLPIVLALYSSLRHYRIPPHWYAWGEGGLTGAVYPVMWEEARSSFVKAQGKTFSICAQLPQKGKRNLPGVALRHVRQVRALFKKLSQRAQGQQNQFNVRDEVS